LVEESRAPQGRSTPVDLRDVDVDAGGRQSTGIPAFDVLLGGGLVPGAVILLGGDPGVGKSTLLLQVAGAMEASGRPVLYASGEESLGQLKVRAARLGLLQRSLVEFALAPTHSQSVWLFKQQEMGGVRRPTRRSIGRGFRFASPPPVSLSNRPIFFPSLSAVSRAPSLTFFADFFPMPFPACARSAFSS
jgi:hypothetical protein